MHLGHVGSAQCGYERATLARAGDADASVCHGPSEPWAHTGAPHQCPGPRMQKPSLCPTGSPEPIGSSEHRERSGVSRY